MLVAICALFVGYIPFVSNHLDATSVLNNAYGQTPSPGDIGSAADPSDPSNAPGPDTGSISGLSDPSSETGPDPSMDDNSTNSLTPGDTSSGTDNSNNVAIQNYTSNAPDSAIVIPSVPETPSTQTVPEFPFAVIVLIIATLSIVLIPKIRLIQKL